MKKRQEILKYQEQEIVQSEKEVLVHILAHLEKESLKNYYRDKISFLHTIYLTIINVIVGIFGIMVGVFGIIVAIIIFILTFVN